MFLNEDYGDSYFTIGTDYYYTSDNLPAPSGRTVERFCSDDPLAYQVGSMPENRYYLDFGTVDPKSALGKKISRSMSTGSLGENYNITYKFIKAYHHGYDTLNLTEGSETHVYQKAHICGLFRSDAQSFRADRMRDAAVFGAGFLCTAGNNGLRHRDYGSIF